MAFEYLQEWKLHNFPWQPVPVLSPPWNGKVFPDVQREQSASQFVPFASGPVTGHHWEVLAPSSLHPCIRCLYTWVRHSLCLLFSKLNRPSSLSFSSYHTCSSPFIIFMALCWSLSSMSMSLILGSLRTARVTSADQWEGTPPPWPVDITCPFSMSLYQMWP